MVLYITSWYSRFYYYSINLTWFIQPSTPYFHFDGWQSTNKKRICKEQDKNPSWKPRTKLGTCVWKAIIRIKYLVCTLDSFIPWEEAFSKKNPNFLVGKLPVLLLFLYPSASAHTHNNLFSYKWTWLYENWIGFLWTHVWKHIWLLN